DENVQFLPRREILTFEEIERFVRVAASLGVNKLRLTGGEPLVRSGVPELVARLAAIEGIYDIALTTNGILLEGQAQDLKDAGLRRITVSPAALTEKPSGRMARREALARFLAGTAAAKAAGLKKIRLNAVAIKGITDPEIVPLTNFARQQGMEMRFIEF